MFNAFDIMWATAIYGGNRDCDCNNADYSRPSTVKTSKVSVLTVVILLLVALTIFKSFIIKVEPYQVAVFHQSFTGELKVLDDPGFYLAKSFGTVKYMNRMELDAEGNRMKLVNPIEGLYEPFE